MRMTKASMINVIKHNKIIIPLAIVFFAFLCDHVFSIWEQPAVFIFITFLLGIPASIVLSLWVYTKVKFHPTWKDERKILLFVSLLIGIAGAWYMSSMPEVYQKIIITPVLETQQNIALVEVKVNGNIISLENYAKESQWIIQNGMVLATFESKPLIIVSRGRVAAPAVLLFNSTSQSGSVFVKNGSVTTFTNLVASDERERSIKLLLGYRGIPYWLFAPFLFVINWVGCSLLIYLLLYVFKQGEFVIQNDAIPTTFVPKHLRNLLILILISSALHTWYALSMPLILDSDSPGYLDTAVHWVQNGTLNGITTIRTPGTTLLFAPFLYLFGRNAWGIKILLHLLGIGCVPLAYAICWKLSKKSALSFITGLLVILIPDMYFLSNFVMADIINIFFILLMLLFFIIALKTKAMKWYVSTLLVISYLILLRPENMISLGVVVFALGIQPIWDLFHKPTKEQHFNRQASIKDLTKIGIATLLACLPILWWCSHNYYQQGFFGLSHSIGQPLYDGWIYFGEASGVPMLNPESKAIKEMNEVLVRFPPNVSDGAGVATGGEIIVSLQKDGYTLDESMTLLKTAAIDAIGKDWKLSMRVFGLKLYQALRPELLSKLTYNLPDEPFIERPLEPKYFDPETIRIPAVILSARRVNQWLDTYYLTIYPFWVWIDLACLFLILLRKPSIPWLVLFISTFSTIFIPLLISHGNWHYTCYALILLQIIVVNSLYFFVRGFKSLIKNRLLIE
jgi:hypothetical protein